MELTEYKTKLEILKEEYEAKQNTLFIEFAMSNNNVKEGDIFTDRIGRIKVKEIRVKFVGLNNIPSCAYYGLEVKNDGTPKKREIFRWAYQINEVKK